jgi:hypothetical protein
MKSVIAALLLVTLALGCGNSAPVQTPELDGNKAPAPSPAPTPAAVDSPPPMRNMPGIKIGDYDVQPMFEEDMENGHYNIRIGGGDVKAVRAWVGVEGGSDTMVVKAELEYDYYHSHHEVPFPIPPGTRFWIELESMTGEVIKGSTEIKLAE